MKLRAYSTTLSPGSSVSQFTTTLVVFAEVCFGCTVITGGKMSPGGGWSWKETMLLTVGPLPTLSFELTRTSYSAAGLRPTIATLCFVTRVLSKTVVNGSVPLSRYSTFESARSFVSHSIATSVSLSHTTVGVFGETNWGGVLSGRLRTIACRVSCVSCAEGIWMFV